MKLSKLRHICYMLGNNQEESLRNCAEYDKCEGDLEKILLINELLNKCADKQKADKYTKEISEIINNS